MSALRNYLITGAAILLMSVSAFAGDAVDSGASIYVNGKEIKDVSAKTYEGYTMVPVRFIAEELGCKVTWDDKENKVTVKDGKTVIDLTVGVNTMIVSDVIERIPAAPIICEDRVFVPLRALSEGLDIDVTWNEMTKTVSVYSASAAKNDYNNNYSEAPEAVLSTVYMRVDEDIVIPINCDPTRNINVKVSDYGKDIISVKEGYLEGQKALFINAKQRGTAGITLYYNGYTSTGNYKTYVNVNVVDRKEKSLVKFDDMLSGKGYFYKDILKEIEDNMRAIESDNELFIFDRTNKEFSKLYVGDEGMIIIPVDYSEKIGGVFDIAYDSGSHIDCKWGEYGGKHAIIITSDNYDYVPVRISFKENNSGKVTFTVTDKDMSVEEVPYVHKFGNNDTDTTVWDFAVSSVAESSNDLKVKNDLVKDRVIYIK